MEYDDGTGMDDDGHVSARGHPVPPHIVANPAAASASDSASHSIDPAAASAASGSIDPTTPDSPHGGPQRSIGGWIIRVSGFEGNANEADILHAFSGFGRVKNLHLNQEGRTAKDEGYALLEYEEFDQAETAIKEMNGKRLLTNVIHVVWAFKRGPVQKAMDKMSGFPYPLDIILSVRRSVEPFRHMEEVARNVFAQHTHTENFLHDSHSAMIPNFAELQALGPHPLLEVQTHEEKPLRWVHCGINAEGTDDWIVLFMRIDNLYTRGFQNRLEAYEISQAAKEKDGVKSVQPEMFPPHYNCVLLDWDVQYSFFFDCNGENELLEVELQKIARDRDFIFEAVQFLSNYKHPEGEAEARKKLGGIIFFLCEFLRMNLSSGIPDEVAINLIDKAQTWGDVCVQLLHWRWDDFKDWYTSRDYKEPPSLWLRLKNLLKINSEVDALRLERLVLNQSANALENQEKNPNHKMGTQGNWKADDKRRAQRRKRSLTQGSHHGAGAGNSDYHQGAPLEDGAYSLQSGRRRVQLLSITANFAVEWVDFHDWHRPQAIYRRELVDDQIQDNRGTELAMVGCTRPIGAYSCLGVEVCPARTSTSREDVRRANPATLTNHKGAIVQFWNVDNYNDMEPTLHYKDIPGLFEDERLRIDYMLVPNSVEARVGVQLHLKGRGGIHEVTGRIEAWHKSTGNKHMVLFSEQTVKVLAGQWSQLPLMVSLLCLPQVEDIEINLSANLTIHRRSTSGKQSLKQSLKVPMFKLSQTVTKKLYQVDGNKIAVSLILANRESTHPQPEVERRHPSTLYLERPDKVYLTIELPDAKDVKLKMKPDGHFYFSAKGCDEMQYELDLDLFAAINVEESKASVTHRTICYLVKKAETNWWPRLLKKEGKLPVFMKVDWDKWQNEYGEEAGVSGCFGDIVFSKLNIDDDDDDDNMVDSANKGAEDDSGHGASSSSFNIDACAAAEDDSGQKPRMKLRMKKPRMKLRMKKPRMKLRMKLRMKKPRMKLRMKLRDVERHPEASN